MKLREFTLTAALFVATGGAWVQAAPGPVEIDGKKVLTLVSNDPPGLRCNNNIQVAAELANTYKMPILIYPVSYMPPGTKAPMVWYGGENIAASGGKLNGMVSFTEIANPFEVEGVAKQEKAGLLITPAAPLAHRALQAEPDIGLLLPCNVIVREEAPGRIVVEFLDPQTMVGLVGKPVVKAIADEAESRLRRVCEALGGGSTSAV